MNKEERAFLRQQKKRCMNCDTPIDTVQWQKYYLCETCVPIVEAATDESDAAQLAQWLKEHPEVAS